MPLIIGKHLPRRRFLRGMGVTVALPFLDSFIPAGRSSTKTAAAQSLSDPTRLWRFSKFDTNVAYTLLPDAGVFHPLLLSPQSGFR